MQPRDVPGFFGFAEIYDEAVAEARDGARFLELGILFGASTLHMAQAIRASGKAIDFLAVDLWPPGELADKHMRELAAAHGGVRGAFEHFERETGLAGTFKWVQADQEAALLFVPPVSLNFAFIDTCHRYGETLRTLLLLKDRIKPGCVIAGDDYTPDWPGVVQAVNEVLPGAVARDRSFYWRAPS